MDETTRGNEQAWWSLLLAGVAALLLGVLLVTSPERTVVALVAFIGAYWVVRGVIGLAEVLTAPHTHRGWRLFAAIVSILAGGFVLAYPLVNSVLLPLTFVITLGVLAVVSGLAFIFHAAGGGGGASVVLGVFDLLVGVALLAEPYVAALALPFVLGAMAIVGGVVLIGVSFMLRGHQHSEEHHMAHA